MHQYLSKYIAVLLTVLSAGGIFFVYAQNTEPPAAPKKVGYPLMESPHSTPIAVNGKFVYVTNTPSSTVDVIDRESDKVVERIHVGIDPVSIAVRPDGKEVWVSNHVSDSVSVIDTDPQSPTFHVVIATIQEFDSNKATTFDEPVGIAFASNEKAYVALSSANQIAVIDVKSRKIKNRLKIPAQDPRAITVKNGYLFVMPFESGNKTQLSGGYHQNSSSDGLVTFDAFEHSAKNNNVLSVGFVEDLIKHYKQPDIDLFIFDITTDSLKLNISSLGTLLYGLTVDAKSNIFIAQTDARNDANGKAGTKKHGLKELQNRPYLNQITTINLESAQKDPYIKATFIDLEPLPPKQPDKDNTFAKPYSVELISNERFLIATAFGSNSVFTVDPLNKLVGSKVVSGAGPAGIAIDDKNSSQVAWIYNALDNSVSKINYENINKISNDKTIILDDATVINTKLGRQYFNSAAVSTTGTFSCASCHPNGHTDQQLWVLDTPIVDGGKQIQPRSSMPIRGLRDTEPFHWDGTQGDPYGGNNATNNNRYVRPNCRNKETLNCITSLINNNINSTMKLIESEKSINQPLTDSQIKNLAIYNFSIPYPSSQKRPFDDFITSRAIKGFELFHIKGDNNPKQQTPNVCGDCHPMPHWTSTNTPGQNGMDAPTWRGAYDRHLILPQGRLNIIDFPWIAGFAKEGRSEFKFWQLSWSGDTGPRTAFDPVWDMVLEGSTGFSGAFARQLTLSKDTFPKKDTSDVFQALDFPSAILLDLLASLEKSATQGKVVLEVEGAFIDDSKPRKFEMQFDGTYRGGSYIEKSGDRKHYARSDLLKLAEQGKFVGTFTARHGAKSDLFLHPQPAIWTVGPIQEQRGRQKFPTLTATEKTMLVSGRHFKDDAHLFVDGQRVDGTVRVKEGEKVTIALANLPAVGMHLLQVQEPEGRMSNDFIFHVK
jgi:YVTN family beta-propeller protein